MHNHNIIESVNLIKQFEDLSSVQEEPGEFLKIPDSELRTKKQWIESWEKLRNFNPNPRSNLLHK